MTPEEWDNWFKNLHAKLSTDERVQLHKSEELQAVVWCGDFKRAKEIVFEILPDHR